MEFFIKLKKEKAELVFGDAKKSISSRQSFSEKLLPAIAQMLKKHTSKNMPKFIVVCNKNASSISYNVAKAIASALNLDINC